MFAIERTPREAVVGTSVLVNTVVPWPTRSESLPGWMTGIAESQGITVKEGEAQFLKTMRSTSLINRFANTEEVANRSSMRVDGGIV